MTATLTSPTRLYELRIFNGVGARDEEQMCEFSGRKSRVLKGRVARVGSVSVATAPILGKDVV